MQPPDDTFDEKRLKALARSAILDTPAEAGFDDIVQLVTQICEVPVALVSFVAADRQWFKARVGFEPCETDLGRSICVHALIEPDLLIIPDLTADERTRTNPLVTGEPHVRFYAGAPLRTPTGEVVGSLCAIDTVPRPGGLTGAQAGSLRTLARQVMSLLDLRRAVADRDALLAEQEGAVGRRNGLLELGDRLRDVDTVAEMTRAASAIVGETLAVGRAGFGRIDESGKHIIVEPDWTSAGMASVEGRHRFDDYGNLSAELVRGEPLVITDVISDIRTAADPNRLLALGIRSLVNMPVRERGRTVAVFLVHDSRPRIWTPEVLAFLRNVADRLEVGVARLNAQVDQSLLNQELSHRMKNSFAMVQAIASQTLRSVPEREPVEAFTRRLQTLSTAHDLLLHQSWSGARLDDMVRVVLGALIDPSRFEMSGPELDLGPRATLSASLLLHELATNALKYGSLSVDSGRVAIAWRMEAGTQDPELVLSWSETGGPPAVASNRKGFGSRLIQAGLIGTGGVDLRYHPTGFAAEFTAPLSQVRRS